MRPTESEIDLPGMRGSAYSMVVLVLTGYYLFTVKCTMSVSSSLASRPTECFFDSSDSLYQQIISSTLQGPLLAIVARSHERFINHPDGHL